MIDRNSWQKLVNERNKWVAHNFPDTPSPDGSILGMIEELGELAHSHLKEEQAIRGRARQHQIKARDAIGDLTIYMLGVMSFTDKVPSKRPVKILEGTERGILKQLSHEVGLISINASIYGCERVVYLLEKYCEMRYWDYGAIVFQTWAKVRERDWIKYPDTGLPSQADEASPVLPRLDNDHPHGSFGGPQ